MTFVWNNNRVLYFQMGVRFELLPVTAAWTETALSTSTGKEAGKQKEHLKQFCILISFKQLLSSSCF